MRLSPNFTLAEFTASETARRLKLDNAPNAEQLANLRAGALCLEGVRLAYRRILGRAVPIVITSAFRNERVNVEAGGVPATASKPASAHVYGCAFDFKVPSLSLFEAATLIEGQVPYDQLIYERGRCVHISFGRFVVGDQLRMQSLTQHGAAHTAFLPGLVR